MANNVIKQMMIKELFASEQRKREAERAQKIADVMPGLMGQPERQELGSPPIDSQIQGDAFMPGMAQSETMPATGMYDESVPMAQRSRQFNQGMMESAIPQLQEQAMKNISSNQRGQQSGAIPSNVREWQYYNSLPPEDQKRFIDMKRQNMQIAEIGGVDTLVNKQGGGMTPLSTLQGEASANRELEKGTASGRNAAKAAETAMNTAEKTRQNVTNLKEVIRLVKEEGAETGPLAARMPSLRAGSIKLDNMQKQLGLDVIGAVTFGALSKGELDLALSKALPTNLEGPELVKWVEAKIAAQEKLADYFENQAIYLSQPGNSRATWLQKMKADKSGQSSPNTVIDSGNVNDLVNKYAN